MTGPVGRTPPAEAARRKRRLPGRRALVAVQLLVAGLAACDSPQNVLDPRGPAAARIAELWWILLVMGVVVSVVVTLLLLMAIRRSRQRQRGLEKGEINGRALVWIGGGIITPVVILALVAYSYRVGTDVYPPLREEPGILTVELVGHQFWWEVRYPQYGILSANEIYIPAGRPVRFLVTSQDVIHSVWIPQLQGKIDMIPGQTTRLRIRADEPGRFRGQCAEYCGVSHALMALWVVAVPEQEFTRWADERRLPRPEPTDQEVLRGRAVFVTSECHLCHAAPGVERPSGLADAGPDLTHLARRRTLGAGTLPNTRGNLAGWITNPQRIKPGAQMPPTALPADQLRALLAYLESAR